MLLDLTVSSVNLIYSLTTNFNSKPHHKYRTFTPNTHKFIAANFLISTITPNQQVFNLDSSKVFATIMLERPKREAVSLPQQDAFCLAFQKSNLFKKSVSNCGSCLKI